MSKICLVVLGTFVKNLLLQKKRLIWFHIFLISDVIVCLLIIYTWSRKMILKPKKNVPCVVVVVVVVFHEWYLNRKSDKHKDQFTYHSIGFSIFIVKIITLVHYAIQHAHTSTVFKTSETNEVTNCHPSLLEMYFFSYKNQFIISHKKIKCASRAIGRCWWDGLLINLIIRNGKYS